MSEKGHESEPAKVWSVPSHVDALQDRPVGAGRARAASAVRARTGEGRAPRRMDMVTKTGAALAALLVVGLLAAALA